jgi:hypothetical protein
MEMNQRIVDRLSKRSERRMIERLENGQVELRWEQVVLRMRTTDLIVLNNALQDWMEKLDREWAQTYSLWLGEYVMFIQWSDLHSFCAMVNEASGHLSRRSVYWADLMVRIEPFGAGHANSSSGFSLN